MLPKISVIIPSYNNAIFLKETLQSVNLQTYQNLEVILVDDGSTDNTKEVITAMGLGTKYHFIAHSGAGAARNHGVMHAEGEYLAFLDSDDLWPPEKLFVQLDYMMANNLEASFTAIDSFLDRTVKELKIKEGSPVEGISATTMLISKSKFLEIGFFETQYTVGEFIDWFLRAKRCDLKYGVVMDVVSKRRIHDNNTSSKYKMNKKDYLDILQNSLEKRKVECLT